MKKKYDSYELEIILSLGFLMLFLISINFISGYSFERARRVQAIQFEKNLNLASACAVAVLEKDADKLEFSRKLLEERLQLVSLLTGINDIVFTDTLGRVFSLTSGISRPGRNGLNSVQCPVSNGNGKVVGRVALYSVNHVGLQLDKLSRWDTIFRIVGLISALIVGSYFLWVILIPYRRIKNEALDFNLDLEDSSGGKGIEYIVSTFKEVIAELEEKKNQLEVMYHDSEKRADSLARYNEYILGSITSGVIICDSDGIVTRFNRSAQNIFQQLEKDCRGRHYKKIFTNVPALTSMFDDALYKKITHSRREFEVKRGTGEKLWLGCSSSLINDERGEGMGAALLLIDLTEIRRLQEISSYSEKMIALGETAAGLAHEVRNSFAAILGFARLIQKAGNFEGQPARLVDAIKDESLAAENLMSRFLNYARPLEMHLGKVDIYQLFETAILGICHPALGKINIKKSVQGDLPPFDGDELLLRQALTNLILNACDALPNGGEIKLRAAIADSGQGHRKELVLSVTDNGLGIKPETMEKIFEPFFTDKQNGTGLGLPLVKKIVVLHNGRIIAQSRPGKGTRFIMYLPLRDIDNIKSPEADIYPVMARVSGNS